MKLKRLLTTSFMAAALTATAAVSKAYCSKYEHYRRYV